MTWHAFIDESTRRDRYLICVASCAPSDLADARQSLRGLLLSGQRRIHFATESDRRRRSILGKLGGLHTTSVIYIADHRDQPTARAAIFEQLTADLADLGTERLTIESRSGQDHHDRAAIYRHLGPDPPMVYQHLTASEEPMLWIPDAIAWAFGRGGDWRRQLDRLGLVASVQRVDVA